MGVLVHWMAPKGRVMLLPEFWILWLKTGRAFGSWIRQRRGFGPGSQQFYKAAQNVDDGNFMSIESSGQFTLQSLQLFGEPHSL